MVGRYDRHLCSRSLLLFNPLLATGQSTSLHLSSWWSNIHLDWIQLPDFFSFDLSLILLKPSHACPTATSTSNSHTAKSALMPNWLFEMGPSQVNHTRTTVKDQQRLRIYRTRNSMAIGIIISHNLCLSIECNKSTFDKTEIFGQYS